MGKLITKDKWMQMQISALFAINHAAKHNARSIREKRIAITSLDQGTELLMKSYLLKNDYIINELNYNKIKERGTKREVRITENVIKGTTISFRTALSIVSKELGLEKEIEKQINKMHEFRNEIQHTGQLKPSSVKKSIDNYSIVVEYLFDKMFPNNDIPYPYFGLNKRNKKAYLKKLNIII